MKPSAQGKLSPKGAASITSVRDFQCTESKEENIKDNSNNQVSSTYEKNKETLVRLRTTKP